MAVARCRNRGPARSRGRIVSPVCWRTSRSAPSTVAIRPASTSRAIATIDLRGAVTRTRLIVFQRSCNSSHAHTVKIVVPGTAGRLRVDLDAIAVMK
jgi:hypothetical protein